MAFEKEHKLVLAAGERLALQAIIKVTKPSERHWETAELEITMWSKRTRQKFTDAGVEDVLAPQVAFIMRPEDDQTPSDGAQSDQPPREPAGWRHCCSSLSHSNDSNIYREW